VAQVVADSVTDLASALRLAVTRLARRLRQESTEGDVTPSQLSALATIEREGPVTLGDLAASERVQPPTMTRIVGALTDQGLVAREVDETDRRVVRVRVTPAGRRLLARTRRRKAAFLATRLARLSPEERELLRRALPVLERLLEDR
jgi:DNA-binding MarR family transcriptional regulator